MCHTFSDLVCIQAQTLEDSAGKFLSWVESCRSAVENHVQPLGVVLVQEVSECTDLQVQFQVACRRYLDKRLAWEIGSSLTSVFRQCFTDVVILRTPSGLKSEELWKQE